MPADWRERAYTLTETAQIAGIGTSALRMLVHRHGGDGYSAKRGGRRWFSARDIAVLRTALALGPAMPMAGALIAALGYHREQPRHDAFLVVTGGKVTAAGADYAARAAVETGALVVPLGKIAAETATACASIYET